MSSRKISTQEKFIRDLLATYSAKAATDYWLLAVGIWHKAQSIKRKGS